MSPFHVHFGVAFLFIVKSIPAILRSTIHSNSVLLSRLCELQTSWWQPSRGGRLFSRAWQPSRGGCWCSRAWQAGARFLAVARHVALRAGALLLAVLLHVALFPFRALRAALWALEGGGQADGLVDEVSVHLDLRFRRQRESRTFVLLFPVRRRQFWADDAHRVHICRSCRCNHMRTWNLCRTRSLSRCRPK